MKKRILLISALSFCFLLLLFINAFPAEVSKIEWDPVTLNVDGTACDDLGGYKIYCTTSPPNYANGQDVGNVTTFNLFSITTMSVDGLYTCVVTAYDVWDNESAYSNSVQALKKGTSFFGRDSLKPGGPKNARTRQF